MFSRAFLLAASLALVAALDLASALPLNSRANIDNSGAYLVELPLDHFGDGQGTFKNRFWVYDLAYKPGGPIISVFRLLSSTLIRRSTY